MLKCDSGLEDLIKSSLYHQKDQYLSLSDSQSSKTTSDSTPEASSNLATQAPLGGKSRLFRLFQQEYDRSVNCELLQFRILALYSCFITLALQTPSAAERRAALQCLIRSACTAEEWKTLLSMIRMWDDNDWVMDPTMDTALICKFSSISTPFSFTDGIPVQAIETGQMVFYLYMLERGYTRYPSSKQARHLVHAIANSGPTSTNTFEIRLDQLLWFDQVASNPSILAQTRGNAKQMRSIAPADDIVIGSHLLRAQLQAVADTSLERGLRLSMALKALELQKKLGSWQRRMLDGSGGGATALASNEKWWAIMNIMDCCHALEIADCREILRSAWLAEKKLTLGKEWVLGTKLGSFRKDGWSLHAHKMGQWLDGTASVLQGRAD